MRIICFVLTLLLANVSFARTYTDTDFSYKNKNGNLVVWELQPKMLLYKGNTGYGVLSTEIVQDIVKEYSGSIKEISDYAAASRPQDRLGIWASNNANAYMIEFDNIRDTIKVLGKYEQMIPVIKDENGNLYFLSDGVRISVKQPSAIEAVNKYLESILHTPEFKLTPLISPGEYILHMDDYGVYRNSIYLSTTLSGYAFFSSVHPLMSPVEQVSVKVWLENNGAGTLGEERFLHCEITLPNSYKVSEEEEIAHLTFESVFDINPTVTAATFSSNLSMQQIDENLIAFKDPQVKKAYHKDYWTYSIVYPFHVYTPGLFQFSAYHYVSTTHNNTVGSTLIKINPVFHVSSLLTPMITDIQSIPDNYNYPCVLASISGKSFAYVALICGVLIVLIGVGFNYFFFSSKEPAIVEYIPSFKDILNGLLNGCDQNNWRDVYAKIMSEYLKLNPNYDTRYFPAHEIFDELEKTYARDTAPDIVRLKQLVNLDCCSGA